LRIYFCSFSTLARFHTARVYMSGERSMGQNMRGTGPRWVVRIKRPDWHSGPNPLQRTLRAVVVTLGSGKTRSLGATLVGRQICRG